MFVFAILVRVLNHSSKSAHENCLTKCKGALLEFKGVKEPNI